MKTMSTNLPPDEQIHAGKILRGAMCLGRDMLERSSGLDGAVLDREIEKYILDHGGVAALKGYKPPFSDRTYMNTICLSLNNEAVHGVPNGKIVMPNDIVTIDMVVGYKGWFVDSARTFTSDQNESGKRICDISWAIFQGVFAAIIPKQIVSLYGVSVEKMSSQFGLYPVVEYCGHGIGQQIHQQPQIVNNIHVDDAVFEVGQSYAVEPVLATKKSYRLSHGHEDGWTVAADCTTTHNEDTVFVGSEGIINLTGDNQL